MKSMFKIIQDTPYCSNCGESDWKKNKNGKIYCIYCGHPMISNFAKKREHFKDKIIDKLKELK